LEGFLFFCKVFDEKTKFSVVLFEKVPKVIGGFPQCPLFLLSNPFFSSNINFFFEHPPSPSPLKGLHLSFVFPPLREGKKQVVAEPPPPAMFW